MLPTRITSWLSLASTLNDDLSESRGCLMAHVREVFRDEIFPYIDEELFSVLYSDVPSRPNTPRECCL